MKIAILCVCLVIAGFGFLLEMLTYSHRNKPLPANVKDVFDDAAYKKNQAYGMEQLRFSMISGLIGTAISLVILIFNVHNVLFEFISSYTANIYLTGIFILLAPIFFSMVIQRLLGIYDTFSIEKRYGFNKTKPATFIIDTIKFGLIMLVLASGLLSLFLFLYGTMGDWVFLVFFFVLLAVQLFFAFISPFLIRLFNKLTPLEDGELKDKIKELAYKTGYQIKDIYVVNASKRSTKLNAFATGFGKTKTIGLYDTLIEKLSVDEVIAVLAHEIGHIKKNHILKSMPLSLLQLVLIMTASFFIVARPEVSQAFGFTDTNPVFGIYVMFILLSPILMLLNIPANIQSRKHEYEADAFEKEMTSGDAAVSALKKLYREDLGNLTPHPFVVMLEHSHPTLTQRVARLEDNDGGDGG